MPLPPDLLAVASDIKGFLPDDEAAALHDAAVAAGAGTWLEIGTYCGKSTVHLGGAARAAGAHLVTVDHHRGSEENQAGWQWHDPDLVDPVTGLLDTLPSLRHTVWRADLADVVSVVVASTQQVARWWTTPLRFLFLDGNHTEATAQHDYAAFAQHVVVGGTLAVHDVFPNPADGGQPPWHVVQRAVGSGAFEQIGQVGSLRVLRRIDGAPFDQPSGRQPAAGRGG
ncbi:MAG: class I SAM-dependent methyltransferase [Candidatus Nanopelagicales bacterium]|nr:class I SAM-dependent methyltransferase [Candidatus Nanopelagicales bacterium]